MKLLDKTPMSAFFMQSRIFNSPLGVWKCGQTQYFVFDVVTSVKIILVTKIIHR